MAKVGCVSNMNLGEKETMMETDDGPPSKKMKQGRLPFKPLDHAGHARQSNTPPGSKKRKLSDNESPSAKQLRTGVPSNVGKPVVVDGEHEVSSSSEAEVAGDINKHVKKLNTIDKFFRPKANVLDQEEISSTNELIEIDLTDEANVVDKDVNDVAKETVKALENASKDISKSKPVTKVDTVDCDKVEKNKDDTKVCDTDSKGKDKDVASQEDKESTSGDSGNTSQTEDKENVSDIDADSSFIANTSVCEDALKTPKRGAVMESALKTPVASTSAGNNSQGSASEGTPISGQKKPSVLSESKRKEREAQRQRIKEEKDKQREEQRLQKEREKEEKKKEILEKKKQKEEQKEKERLEKEKQKQEEKEKKEKERLEKVKQKEELKKQKEKELESKNEEKRKKDEERKQKEEEKKQKEEEKRKEEEEKQRKADKKKEMFKGFFIQKEPTVSPPKMKEMKNGLFMPFELKPNMKLAPSRRSPLSDHAKHSVDECMKTQDCKDLYLKTVKGSTLGKSFTTWPKMRDIDDDVEILSHEKEMIERVTYRAKFLYFHENTRPAYYGTWRKKSQTLSARNPFKQDEELFDYEVDSDDEWEEEEPGESVSSDEEEKEDEGEKVDDEEEGDDWMVPHGYLSDGEGADEDDEVDMASKQDLQKVRQAAWESELKRQAKPLRMLAIGCAWENDETTTIAAQQLQKLLQYKAVCLMDRPISTSFTVTRSCDTDSTNDRTEKKPSTSNKKSVPEEAMPDLIRLVHGNPVGIKNLVKEFRMYWRKKTNPDLDTTADVTLDSSKLDSSKLDISMDVEEKTDSRESKESPKPTGVDTPKAKAEAEKEFAISKRQLEIKIPAIAVHEKRLSIKKLKCWYVKEEILEQYDMKDIQLPNTWEYVGIKPPTWAMDKTVTPKVEEVTKVIAAKPGGDATPKIMKFAQPMSPSMIQALGPVAGNKDVPPVADTSQTSLVPNGPVVDQQTGDLTGSESPNPSKALPADQRRIKDMFSLARKSLKKITGSPKMAAPTTSPIGQLSSDANKIVSPSCKKLTNIKTNPSVVTATPSSDTPVSSTNDITTPNKGSVQTAPASTSNVTPKASHRNVPVLKSILSSPELMKATAKEECQPDESASKEQPMDVDIIVIE